MMAAIWARVIGHHRERGRPAKCSPHWPAGLSVRRQSQGGSRRVVASVSGGWCARVFLLAPQKCGADAARLVADECSASW
jgi:hypothetical protein